MEAGHLYPQERPFLERSDKERIERIRSERWIPYPRATAVLDRLEQLRLEPKRDRMPYLLIKGMTNIGKTRTIRRYQQLHPTDNNPGGESASIPVLYVVAPPQPDEGRLYTQLLDALHAPFRPEDRVGKKEYQLFKILESVQVGLIVIDEIHNILSGSSKKHHDFQTVIKSLGNHSRRPVVGVGTGDAWNAISSDAQLANRFEVIDLPQWEPNEDFLELLVTIGSILPLKKPSHLEEPEMASHLFEQCEGLFGELWNLLTRAAVEAVMRGTERIDRPTLEAVNWQRPSDRTRLTFGL